MANEPVNRPALITELLEVVAALLLALLPFIERRVPVIGATVLLLVTAVAVRYSAIPPPEVIGEVQSVDDEHPMARTLITTEG